MPYCFFFRDGENDDHVRQHGVTPEEFEEVALDPERVERSRNSNREIAFGWTSTGKYVAGVYEFLDDATIYPVTAFLLDEQEEPCRSANRPSASIAI